MNLKKPKIKSSVREDVTNLNTVGALKFKICVERRIANTVIEPKNIKRHEQLPRIYDKINLGSFCVQFSDFTYVSDTKKHSYE